MELKTAKIAEVLGGTVEGDAEAVIKTFARIESGKPGSICFLANPKYEQYLYGNEATAVIVNRDFQPREAVAATLIRVDDAYDAVARLLAYVTARRRAVRRYRGCGCHIAFTARLGKKVYVGSGACIAAHARIGDGTHIGEQVYVGEGTRIGKDCVIYPGVRIYPGMVIGDRVILHSGVVIGADGFGFAPQEDGSYRKIEHTGNVIIGNDVEIGANTTVDKSQIGSTIIRDGVKIDNLVQIAHNVEIGENTVICAQTGIAGSTKIGRGVTLTGQVGVVGHISIADKVMVGAKSAITKTITEEGAKYYGNPAIPHEEFLRSYVIFRKNGRRK